MKHKVESLKADVEDELAKLARLDEVFAADAEPKLALSAAEVDQYDRAAIG